jgi:hypothetical protein
MSNVSGMRNSHTPRRRVVKRVAKRTVRARAGNWNILGLYHGGKEGRAWQRGKAIVAQAKRHIGSLNIKTVKAEIKSGYAQAIQKLGKLPQSEKNKLIDEINRIW